MVALKITKMRKRVVMIEKMKIMERAVVMEIMNMMEKEVGVEKMKGRAMGTVGKVKMRDRMR